ncbi:MAG: Ger(x)C family spore germination protein [Syntrophomonadaceae bacterium]|nr:Ger(x)C family spore germination protein [Syntrophomonadaceae bacterium]
MKIISLFLCLSIALSGCWDKNELTSLAITTGVAFDTEESEEDIQMTAQIINLGTLAPAAVQSSIANPPYWNLKTRGKTVFDCIRNATMQSPKKLYWAHNQIIVFSEDLARQEGVGEYLDFFFRDAEPRISIWLLVSKGSASDILKMDSKLDPIPAMNISSLIENRSNNAKASAVDLYEFSNRQLSQATAPVMSYIQLLSANGEKTPLLSGTAVFNRDFKMIGTLNERETRGMLWVINHLDNGLLVMPSPQDEVNISIEVISAKTKIEPQIINGELKIKILVREKGVLGDADGFVDVLDKELWNRINQGQAAVIRQDILLSLEQARLLKADIFGFGDAVYKKYPREWKEIKEDWIDIFPALEVEIQVQTALVRPNMILHSINK